MNDHTELAPDDLSFWGMHRFLLLMAGAITIALTLVGISMALYASSGAAQLDLSRPDYQSVSRQAVKNDDDFENYPAFGQIDQKSLSEFKALYSKQSTKSQAVDAFSGDPLNPDALEISAQAPPVE